MVQELSHCGDLGSDPGQSVWDLQWTILQWGSPSGFAVDSVAVGQSVSISPIEYFASAPYSVTFNLPLYITEELTAS